MSKPTNKTSNKKDIQKDEINEAVFAHIWAFLGLVYAVWTYLHHR